VPAALEFVRIVRLTASGVASRLGFDVEDIEDLRVAVDELASIVVDDSTAGDLLEVVFSVAGATLRIEGRVPTHSEAGPILDELTSQILAAVVDGYEVESDNGYVRFSCDRKLPAN
jgi:serine/threonine-protein kinase RsbW